MGKSTILTGPFSIAMLVITRGYLRHPGNFELVRREKNLELLSTNKLPSGNVNIAIENGQL